MDAGAANPETHARFLIVRCGGQTCALPLHAVLEVLRPPRLEHAADGTRGLVGFATLRGEPAAVFELAALLGLAPSVEKTDAEARRAVRLRVGARAAAVLVDGVEGLKTLAPEQRTRIDLPGGGERLLGRFDEAFARLLEPGGLVPDLPLREPGAAQ